MNNPQANPPEQADDLNLDTHFRLIYGVSDLDAAQEMDRALLDEFARIKTWAGISGELVYWTRKGTAANTANVIGINRNQMADLYGAFSEENRRIAFFMVLAHEAGHLCQYKQFGVKKTLKRPRKVIEAHADLLSGVWLGVRLATGSPDNVEAAWLAALRLTKGDPALYPPAEKRAELVVRGRGALAMLVSQENILKLAALSSPVVALAPTDVNSLYDIANEEELG